MEPLPRVLPTGADQPSQPAEQRGSDYAALSRHVRQAGLLDRRLRYYFWKIALTTLALVAGWTAFALLGDSWWQLGTAVFLAVVFAQLGFLGHDAGHQQVFSSKRANYILGVLCGNLAIGLSYGWWTHKHNRTRTSLQMLLLIAECMVKGKDGVIRPCRVLPSNMLH